MTVADDNIIPASTFSRHQRIAHHTKLLISQGCPPAEALEWSWEFFTNSTGRSS